jgi:hypothetical protein
LQVQLSNYNWLETTLICNNKPVYDDTGGRDRLTPSAYQGYYTFEFTLSGNGDISSLQNLIIETSRTL